MIAHTLEEIVMNPDTSPSCHFIRNRLTQERQGWRGIQRGSVFKVQSSTAVFSPEIFKGSRCPHHSLSDPGICLRSSEPQNPDKQPEKSMPQKACLLGLTKPWSLLSLGLYQTTLCCLEFKIPMSFASTQTLFRLVHFLHFWAFQSSLAQGY